jgi:hypothetical protein
MSAQDASYYDYDDGDREDARREAAARARARARLGSPPEWTDEDEVEDCGGGRGGCPGCDGCEVARQVYRIRRARVAHRTTGGQVIAPGDYYGEVAVRIFQRGGPVIQRRRVVYAMPATGVAAWFKAGSPRRVDGMQFTRFTR